MEPRSKERSTKAKRPSARTGEHPESKLRHIGGLINNLHLSNASMANLFQQKLLQNKKLNRSQYQNKKDNKSQSSKISSKSPCVTNLANQITMLENILDFNAKRSTIRSSNSNSNMRSTSKSSNTKNKNLEVLVKRLLENGGPSQGSVNHLTNKYAYFQDIFGRKQDSGILQKSKFADEENPTN